MEEYHHQTVHALIVSTQKRHLHCFVIKVSSFSLVITSSFVYVLFYNVITGEKNKKFIDSLLKYIFLHIQVHVESKEWKSAFVGIKMYRYFECLVYFN